MRSSQFVCVTGLIFALAAAPAMAQTGAGSIQDTVKDASGALVPKAGVKIVHLATSVALETMTNGAGFYAFSQTPIERYRIFAQAPGMSPWVADVEVSTGQTAVMEATLKVGTNVSGYIPANQINTHNTTGQCNGICGVPDSYKSSSVPVIPLPATPIPNDPNAAFYGTNTVYVPLKNGTLQRTTINTSLHPWQNQYINGPGTFGLDASIFKNIPITERVLQNSANSVRTMQLSIRLTW